MKNLDLEIAKTQASLDNLINCIKNNCDVDILGSLYVIKDQLNKIDEAAE